MQTGVMVETFETARSRMLLQRLNAARIMGIAGMAFFALNDWLVHPDSAATLLGLRIIAIWLMLSTFLLDSTDFGKRNPHITLMFMVWSLTLPMIHMSAELGGYTSNYYFGSILIHCGAVALMPVMLRTHLVAQSVTLVYYYGLIHFVHGDALFIPHGLETVFFHVWFFGLLDIAIFSYERLSRERFAGQQELEIAHTRLVERDRLKTNYLLRRNDEIRSLTGILANRAHDGIVQTDKDKSPSYQQMFRTLERTVERLRTILFNLLDLAQLESGAMPIRPATGALGRSLAEAVANTGEIAAARGVTIRNNVPADSCFGRTDMFHVRRIVEALLRRLVADAKPAQGRITIERVNARPGAPEHVFRLTGDGIGMTPEQKVRAFLPYTEEDPADSTPLPVARMLARALGGDIRIEGEFGSGLGFVLTVPVDRTLALVDDPRRRPVAPGMPVAASDTPRAAVQAPTRGIPDSPKEPGDDV